MTGAGNDRPGPVGRAVRILVGVALLALFVRTLSGYPRLVGFAFPTAPTLWAGVAVSLYFVADVVNRGFGVAWGRWPRTAWLLLALAAAVFNLAQYGAAWGPPLGFLIFVLLAYVTGHLGLSFIVAGLEATPG